MKRLSVAMAMLVVAFGATGRAAGTSILFVGNSFTFAFGSPVRFYRADTSRARASGGTGLGLSIVAAVTEAHGGTAEARPTPGGGATFVVTLPLGAD